MLPIAAGHRLRPTSGTPQAEQHDRDDEGVDVAFPAVAERMRGCRSPLGTLAAQPQQRLVAGVGQRVDRLREHRGRRGQQERNELGGGMPKLANIAVTTALVLPSVATSGLYGLRPERRAPARMRRGGTGQPVSDATAPRPGCAGARPALTRLRAAAARHGSVFRPKSCGRRPRETSGTCRRGRRRAGGRSRR